MMFLAVEERFLLGLWNKKKMWMQLWHENKKSNQWKSWNWEKSKKNQPTKKIFFLTVYGFELQIFESNLTFLNAF